MPVTKTTQSGVGDDRRSREHAQREANVPRDVLDGECHGATIPRPLAGVKLSALANHGAPVQNVRMPRRRESFSLRLVAALCVSVTAASCVRAQPPRAHVDTVLVARDLDGDGNTDYIVRESRASRGGLQPRRLAIYLGVGPGVTRASWATEWDDEFGGDVTVAELLPLGTSSTLISVSQPEADYEGTQVVLIRARRAKTIVSHGIDYGEGYFQLRLEGGRAVVDATQEHLVIGGKPVDGTLACPDAQLPALRLVFDPRAERFVPEHPRCVKPPGTS